MPDSTDNHARLVPLEDQKRNLATGLTYFQESVELHNGRITNLHWVEFDKDKIKFKLESSLVPIPLLDFGINNKKVCAGINFGSFFLSDDLHSPRHTFYNCLISNGDIFQFPSNSRPVLSTRSGRLSFSNIPAMGTLKIGGGIFTWSGSNLHENTDLKIFGVFDLTINKYKFDDLSSRRKILEYTNKITCASEEFLLGFNIVNGQPMVDEISNQSLDLTQFAFVIRGNLNRLNNVAKGQKLTEVKFGNNEFIDSDVCSASFSLGKTKEELTKNLNTQLVYPVNGQPKPVAEDYLKSWSVVLETKDKVIFFINDARPKVKNQEGITVFELQQILKDKFDYIWGCVGDSGQSSKLMIKSDIPEIYGNMHYLNYRINPPLWNGINGRSISVALLAYE